MRANPHSMISFRNTRFALLVSLGCLLVLGYFAWHAWHGPRGYAYSDGLALKLSALEVEVEQIEQKRLALESRVALMRPERVDIDMLEELARSTLGMVRSNDLLVTEKP